MSMTAFAPIRTSVVDQLTALGVDVHHVSYGPGHVFGWCEHCEDLTSVASYTVYPRDEPCTECCVNCVVSVTDQAVTDSFGRSDCCTVEIGTVEDPRPTVVLDTRDRSSDLDDPHCEQHARTATFAIQTEQHERGLYCDRCVADGMRLAFLAGGFTPAAVSAVDLYAYRMAGVAA